MSLETFTKVYLNMPLTVQASQNRQVLAQRLRAQAEKARLAAGTPEPPLVAPSSAATGTNQPVVTKPNTGGVIILTQPAASPVPVEAPGQKESPQITPKEPVASSSPQSPTPTPSQPSAQDPKRLVQQQVPAPQVLQPIVRTGIGRFLSEEEF